jgi:hypothetical protein
MKARDPQPSSTGCARSFACNQIADLNVTGEYTIGVIEFECWNKLWKARPSDPDVDSEEWMTFVGHIQEHFRRTYENFPDEFYFLGDFSSDRTLDLKIVKPAILTGHLLSDLQKYLQLNGQEMWRIRVNVRFRPDDPHRVIVIYADTIDILPLAKGTPTSSFAKATEDSSRGTRIHTRSDVGRQD